jgi:hypothetical protein
VTAIVWVIRSGAWLTDTAQVLPLSAAAKTPVFWGDRLLPSSRLRR